MVESTRPRATGAKVLARQTKGEITYAAKAMSTARGTGGEGRGKKMREEAQGDDSNQKASNSGYQERRRDGGYGKRRGEGLGESKRCQVRREGEDGRGGRDVERERRGGRKHQG